MIFHRRAFLRAMGVVTAAPGLRAAGLQRDQLASTKRKRYEMEIKRVGTQPSGQGAVRMVYGAVRIERFSRRLIPPWFKVPALRLSQVHEPHGIPSARPNSYRDRWLWMGSALEQVVPWRKLCALVEPHYPKPGSRRPAVGWSAGRISPTGTPQQRQEQYSPSHG